MNNPRNELDKQPAGEMTAEQLRDRLLSAVLASDLAGEVEAEFKGRRSVGFSVSDATQHVFGRFHAALSSTQDGPVVLLSLAALQLRADHLQPVIRDAALDLIDSGEALSAYRADDFTQRKGAKEVLGQFGKLLAEADVRE